MTILKALKITKRLKEPLRDYEYVSWYKRFKKNTISKKVTREEFRESTVFKKLVLINILSFKKYQNGITKDDLFKEYKKRDPVLKIGLGSARKWVELYNEGGFKLLLTDDRAGGNRARLMDKKIANEIQTWINNKEGTANTYKDLQKDIAEKYKTHLPYTTLRNYIKRNFEIDNRVATEIANSIRKRIKTTTYSSLQKDIETKFGKKIPLNTIKKYIERNFRKELESLRTKLIRDIILRL